MTPPRPIRIFVSYAHKDSKHRDELVNTTLKDWADKGVIEVWADNSLTAGRDWERTTKAELERADLIIFLMSRDAVASGYIRDVEMKLALQRENQGKVCLVPIILAKCDWRAIGLGHLEPIPPGRKLGGRRTAESIAEYRTKAEAWGVVRDQLKRTIEDLRGRTPAQGPPPHVLERSAPQELQVQTPLQARIRSGASTTEAAAARGGVTRMSGKTRRTLFVTLVLLLCGVAVAWPFFHRSRDLRVRPDKACSLKPTVLLGSIEDTTGAAMGKEAETQLKEFLDSEGIRFSDPEALLRMRRNPSEVITEEVGKDASEREDIPFFLSGTVMRHGRSFQVNARLLVRRATTAGTEWSTAAEYVDFSRMDELRVSVAALESRILAILGRPENCISQTKGSALLVTTGSRMAWSSYRNGIHMAGVEGRSADAKKYFKDAIGQDPSFAMAYLQKAKLEAEDGDRMHAAEDFRTAAHLALEGFASEADLGQKTFTAARADFDLRKWFSDREVLLIQGEFQTFLESYDDALHTFERLANEYKQDPDAQLALASAYNNQGNASEAIRILERVPDLDPTYDRAQAALVSLVNYEVREGKFPKARERAAFAERKGIPPLLLRRGRGLAYLGEDRFGDAQSQFQALVDNRQDHYVHTEGVLLLANARVLEGKWKDAEDLLKDGASQDALHGQEDREHGQEYRAAEMDKRYFLARLYFLLDDQEAAWEQLARMRRNSAAMANDFRRMGRLALLFCDRRSREFARDALNLLGEIARRNPSVTTWSFFYDLRGESELTDGERRNAWNDFGGLDRGYFRYISHQAKAAFYGSADRAKALTEWQEVINRKGEILFDDFAADWVIARLEHARILRELGSTEAEGEAAKVRDYWKNADTDVREKVLERYLNGPSSSCSASASRRRPR
jgi:tetratricopeptide (TPR) repeat protein